jgi:signal transduction histidine kinase
VLHAPLPDTLTARLRQETPAQLTGMFIKTPDERNQPSEWKLLLRSIDDIQLGKRPMFTRAQRASLFTFSAILGSLCFITALVFLARWWRQRKKAYAMELILAERKRIAADFHDTIEQGLATASLILKATLERENHTDSRGIQLALQALSTTQNAARAAVWNLQPDALRDRSLSEALQEIVDAIGVSGKIHVACDLSALPAQLPERLATGLYAIVREACANVVKHSQATQLTLTAAQTTHGLTLTLADNGIGFDPAHVNAPSQGHFGLASMRERATRLGLSLTITSTPGTGTTLQVTLPHEVLR